ncbi:MAG: tetratricopeptide repeat protein [Polyangiaceae bacterium]|nr:tetratricopeptide repeat protein [Polyangiaceae bacterium]
MALALGACSSTPEPKEEPLDADPPVSTATAAATEKKNPELEQGEALVKSGKFADAKPHLEAALKEDPKSAPAAFYLALATEQTKGDLKEAERLYKQALTFDPKLADAALNLAAIYLADPPRPDEAIAIVDKALAHSPGDPKLLTNLGYAYSLKKDHEKAQKALSRALAAEDTPELRLMLGTALFEGKKPTEAVPHLLKAAEAMKDDAAVLATIARMMGPAKAFDDCVRLLDRALELKANEPELLVRRGVCKHELKKEKEAGEDFKAAIKADPKFQPAHYYLGLSFLAQGKKNEARTWLRKAWELGKDTGVGKASKEKLDGIK